MRDELLRVLREHDGNRDRSQQVEVGPSQAGGCARQTWHEFRQTPPSNDDTSVLAALMGTAIHAEIAAAMKSPIADPWGDRYLVEVEVKAGWLKGHVDLFDTQTCEVVDWKTTTKKNMGYLGSKQQRAQVQLYGWLLSENGYQVEKVTLVGIARDGDEGDVVEKSFAYDPEAARKALDALEAIRDQDDPPAPEKPAGVFCSRFCVFYDPQAAPDSKDSCPGKSGGR